MNNSSVTDTTDKKTKTDSFQGGVITIPINSGKKQDPLIQIQCLHLKIIQGQELLCNLLLNVNAVNDAK